MIKRKVLKAAIEKRHIMCRREDKVAASFFVVHNKSEDSGATSLFKGDNSSRILYPEKYLSKTKVK